MKRNKVVLTVLSLALAGGSVLSLQAQTNEEQRKDAQAQTKQDRKASKEQAEADKKANKALKSDKVKDAARSQDKADAEASRTPSK